MLVSFDRQLLIISDMIKDPLSAENKLRAERETGGQEIRKTNFCRTDNIKTEVEFTNLELQLGAPSGYSSLTPQRQRINNERYLITGLLSLRH